MSSLKAYLKKLKCIQARGTTYTIKFCPNLEDEGQLLHGFCDPNDKIIALNDSSPDKELLDTFLHEFLHAIWHETGLSNEPIPTWVEHIYLCGIVSDCVNQKDLMKKLFTLK